MAVPFARHALATALFVCFAHLASAQQLRLAKLEPLPVPSATPDKLPDDARLRIGSLRFRDGGQIFGAAVSPDARILAVASQNGYVRLLELDTGKEIRRLTTGGLRNNTIQFTQDGKTLITHGYNGTNFWRVEDGKVERTLANNPNRQREGLHSVSGDGRFMSIATPDYNAQNGKAVVMDLENDKQLCEVSTLHNNSLFSALSHDGKRMMTWGHFYDRTGNNNNVNPENHNGTVQIWDAVTGKELRKIKTEAQTLFSCQFSRDGKKVITSGGGTIQIWDAATGNAERRFASRASQGTHITFSPDGKSFAAASNRDSTIQAWELETGKRLGTYEGPPQTVTAGMSYRPDGGLIAWGISGSMIHVWEATTGKRLTPSTGHAGPISGLLFVDGGKTLVSTSQDGKMLTWDPSNGREKASLDLNASDENRRYYRGQRGGSYNSGYPASSVFSPNGRYMIGNNNDYGTTSIFELPSGLEIFALSSPGRYVDRNGPTVFSPDSTKVAALSRYSNPQQQGIPLWDLDTGLPLPLLKGQNGEFSAGAFSTDGKFFASAAMNYNGTQQCEIWVWDLAAGKEKVKLQQLGYCHAMLFLDGRRLLASSPSGWRMYDAITGKEIGAFEGTMAQVTSPPALSPDGRLLALGVSMPPTHTPQGQPIPSSKIVVWELASGTVRHEYTGHEGGVSALAFSADGKTLASGGQDTTILLWELVGRKDDQAPELSPAELAGAWKTLNERAGKDAERVMRKLLNRPDETLKFLESELKPAEGKRVSDEAIRSLLVRLEANRFVVREKASKELEELGRVALKPMFDLRKVTASPDLERRLDKLIEVIDRLDDSILYVRPLRGIEVLERLNTPEAKAHLKRLAEGASGAVPTIAAGAALKRLNQ